MHSEQRQKTIDLLNNRGVQRALFTHLDSVKWLTGYVQPLNIGLNPFAVCDPLVWYENGHFTLIVLDAYANNAPDFATQPNCQVITYEGYTIQHAIASYENLLTVLATAVQIPSGTSVGVEMRPLLYAVHEHLVVHGADLQAIDHWLVPLRMIKTAEELATLKRNFALVDLGQAVAKKYCQVGTREIEVWSAVHEAINNEIGTPLYLGNDCVVGYRTPNNVGGLPSDLPIKADSALIVDLSTAWGGYWSDSCGTYYPVEPTPKQKTLHHFIQNALEYAISLVKPGAVAKDIDTKVRQFISAGGYPVYPHHTGHGVGVAAHEAPRIVPYNDDVLQAGMVIMLEPGIYFPGETSVRLEDAVLVTADGAEILTTFNKNF